MTTLLKRIVHDALQHELTNPSKLIAALRGAHAEVLYRSCWGLERIRSQRLGGVSFEGWSQVAQAILAAATENGEVIIPQLLKFICKEERFIGPPTGPNRSEPTEIIQYSLDSDAVARLFASELFAEVIQRTSHLKLPEPRASMFQAVKNGLALSSLSKLPAAKNPP